MPESLMKHLTYGNTAIIHQSQFACPLPRVGNDQPLFIVPDDNISEMLEMYMEEGEHETLAKYVTHGIEQLESLNKLIVFRQIADSHFQFWELPEEEKNVANLSFDEIYSIFRKGWDSELVDETIIDSDPVPETLEDQEWFPNPIEEDCISLRLPLSESYLSPLWVPMGGYNECPTPIIQAAIFREWFTQYGAVPILVTESSWVLQVDRTPLNDEEALALAREHFVFCPYVLETGDSLGQYADYLKKQKIWHFWWD